MSENGDKKDDGKGLEKPFIDGVLGLRIGPRGIEVLVGIRPIAVTPAPEDAMLPGIASLVEAFEATVEEAFRELSPFQTERPEDPAEIAASNEKLDSIVATLPPTLLSLYKDFPVEYEARAEQYSAEVSPEIQRVYENLAQSYRSLTDETGACDTAEEIFEKESDSHKFTIRAALAAGIFDNKRRIHVQDLCANVGLVSLVLAYLFRNEHRKFSAMCRERREKYSPVFRVVAEDFGVKSSCKFVQGDVIETSFDNHPGKDVDTYWIARFPSIVIDQIAKKLSSLSPEKRPLKTIIIPCDCHSYRDEVYPFEDLADPIISREDWNILEHFIRRKKGDISVRAAKIADCVRAFSINQRSSSLSATVHNLDGDNNAIIVENRTGD